jgi:DNA invertase Pin-like site-specific DNA recombinase
MIYGYASVSTDGQSVTAQVAQLRTAGCQKVFREVASSAKTDRNQLRRALDHLATGAVLMVIRLDRLDRSTRDRLNTLATISGRKAAFRSQSDTWADTTTPHGRLMRDAHRPGRPGRVRAQAVRARTGQGRKLAKARGMKMSRKPKLTAHQQREALQRRDAGEPTREIARTYNVSHSTISRLTA